MQRSFVRYVGAAVAMALTVAACGGGGDGPEAGTDADEATNGEEQSVDGSEAESDPDEATNGEEEQSVEVAPDEVIEAALPHHMAPGSLDDECINQFADTAEQDTGGGIVFDITPGGALGGEADVQQNLFEGVFEASYMSSVLMGVWHEPAQVLTLPYVFSDLDSAYDVLKSDVMQPVYDGLLEERGVRVLGWCHFSLRNIAATTPIIGPEDLAGLKIRVPETPSFVETFSELGANPTPLPYPEVYTNIQTGLVDAVDSSFSAMYDTNIHEVADHFSETKHIYTAQAIVVNEEWFQSLSEEQREILLAAAASAEDAFVQQFVDSEEETIPLLEEAGVTVTRDVDREAMEEATSGARDDLASQYNVTDLLADIQAELPG